VTFACQQDVDRWKSLLGLGVGSLLTQRRRQKTFTTYCLYDVDEGVRCRVPVELACPDALEGSMGFQLRTGTHPLQRLANELTFALELNVATPQCRPAAFSLLCFV
jgi:hypothetical protein